MLRRFGNEKRRLQDNARGFRTLQQFSRVTYILSKNIQVLNFVLRKQIMVSCNNNKHVVNNILLVCDREWCSQFFTITIYHQTRDLKCTLFVVFVLLYYFTGSVYNCNNKKDSTIFADYGFIKVSTKTLQQYPQYKMS